MRVELVHLSSARPIRARKKFAISKFSIKKTKFSATRSDRSDRRKSFQLPVLSRR